MDYASDSVSDYTSEDEYEFDMYEDSYYYGVIPPNCSKKEFVTIMAKGIIRMKQQAKGHYRINIGETLDKWFEHDSEGDNMFFLLREEDDFDAFVAEVRKMVRKLSK